VKIKLIATIFILFPAFIFGYPKNYPKKEKITEKLYEMMESFHRLLTENNIPYFIIHGTLLGAVRDKELIPWDDDIDLGILEKDIEKFNLLEDKFKDQGFEFYRCTDKVCNKAGLCLFYKICPKDGQEFNGPWYKKYPWIDVMTFVIKDNKVSHHPSGPFSVWKHAYFDKEELFPLKNYSLGKLQVLGPNIPKPFLSRFYPNWQTTYVFWAHRKALAHGFQEFLSR